MDQGFVVCGSTDQIVKIVTGLNRGGRGLRHGGNYNGGYSRGNRGFNSRGNGRGFGSRGNRRGFGSRGSGRGFGSRGSGRRRGSYGNCREHGSESNVSRGRVAKYRWVPGHNNSYGCRNNVPCPELNDLVVVGDSIALRMVKNAEPDVKGRFVLCRGGLTSKALREVLLTNFLDFKKKDLLLMIGTNDLLQPRERLMRREARAEADRLMALGDLREEAARLSDFSSGSEGDVHSIADDHQANHNQGHCHVMNNDAAGPDRHDPSPDRESEPDQDLNPDSDVQSSTESDPESDPDSDPDPNPEPDVEPLNQAEINLNFYEGVKSWATRGVSCDKVDELLTLLQPMHPFLPKTCRTLLQTPTGGPVRALAGGLFWYKGIFVNLQARINQQYLQKFNNEVVLDINMDGIPLNKSNVAHFFPILGCLQDQENPFIIAVWFGYAKQPNNLDLFLQDYVEEVRNLQQNGCNLLNRICNFRIRDYILDSLARAFIKCIIQHNGTYACEKCEVQGVRFRFRQTFTNLNANLRTDESFRLRSNPEHHQQQVSPLETINTGMVSQFRLDPLHLLDLGVFKRWLDFILTGGVGNVDEHYVISDNELNAICEALSIIKDYTPSEFNRRPRPLQRTSNKLKGHELRRLLLYDGIIIFKNLNENLFKNYLLLQCATYILSSRHLRDLIEIADQILREFVTHSRQIFSRMFVVYNVHSLIHLAKECQDHGVLSDFAAYKFENYLGTMKRILRGGYMCLQQLHNRDAERGGHLTTPQDIPEENEAILSRPHQRQGGEILQGDQYQKVQIGKIALALNNRDRCFISKELDVILLSNIIRTADGSIMLVGRRFTVKESVYNFPFNSSNLGIFRVSALENIRRVWNIQELSQKCYIMPDGADLFITVPLVHFRHQ